MTSQIERATRIPASWRRGVQVFAISVGMIAVVGEFFPLGSDVLVGLWNYLTALFQTNTDVVRSVLSAAAIVAGCLVGSVLLRFRH